MFARGVVSAPSGETRTRRMALSDVVNVVINKPVAKAARAARQALERLTPEAASQPSPPARKSKGWRRHVRQAKANQTAAKR